MQDKFLYRYFESLCLAFVFMVPLHSFISVRLEVGLFLVALVLLRKQFMNFLAFSWDSIAYLVFILLGVSYSLNAHEAWRVAETHFSLLALPVIFYALAKAGKLDNVRVMFAFVFGTAVASAVLIAYAALRFAQSGDTSVFLFYELTSVLDFQPTYFAYYLVLAVSVCLRHQWTSLTKQRAIWVAILCVFLFGTLLLSGGRTALVGMLLIFSYYLLLYLTEDKSTRRHWQAFFVLILTISLFGVNAYEQQLPDFLAHDAWGRAKLWIAAVHATPNFWWGAGTGDVQTVLNQYYQQIGLTDFAERSLNPHNQFLHTLVANGIVGVLLLFAMMVRPLVRSVNARNPTLIIYFFPVWIYSISEVILGRYQGVVFFALVYALVNASSESVRTGLASPISNIRTSYEG